MEDKCFRQKKVFNPNSRRCVKRCLEGQIRNDTFRCVKNKTKKHMIIKEAIQPEIKQEKQPEIKQEKQPEIKQEKQPEIKQEKQPEIKQEKQQDYNIERCNKRGKTLNPYTKRCVKLCEQGKTRNNKFQCVKQPKENIIHLPLPNVSDISISIQSDDPMKSVSNEASKNTPITIFNKYAEKGKKYELQGIQFIPTYLLVSMVYRYLLKKYRLRCQLRIYYYLNIRQFYYFYKENIYIQDLEKLGLKMLKCILSMKKNQEVLFIPIDFASVPKNETDVNATGHANILIYRKSLNVIEHFEPHGTMQLDIYSNIQNLYDDIGKLTDTMNRIIVEQNIIDVLPKITYIPPPDVCPSGIGFQRIENELKLELTVQKKEGAGFCAMWSLFFAEMSILNPTMRSVDIIDRVSRWLIRDTQNIDIHLYVRNTMRGYIENTYTELDKILKKLNKKATIDMLFQKDAPISKALMRYLNSV